VTRHPDGYERDGKRYKRKSALIVEHARELVAEGKPVTHAAIMEMLDVARPGHRTYPTEISRALRRVVAKAKRARSGHGVEVKGVSHPSVRAAARAEGISMEAARKRIASPSFPDWKLIG
jgi:hypothetical protein